MCPNGLFVLERISAPVEFLDINGSVPVDLQESVFKKYSFTELDALGQSFNRGDC